MITVDYAGFARQVKAWQRRMEEKIKELDTRIRRRVVLKTALEALKLFSEGTPVDTGRAKKGWYADLQITNWAPPMLPKGAKHDQPDLTVPDIPAGKPILVFVINNVEYILPLEYGHSGQAPQGMVRVGLPRLERMIRTLAEEESRRALR